MFVYNVTIKINVPIHDQWLEWMKNIHIPDMLSTDCFQDATILRLLEVDDTDGYTYAIQYKTESKSKYNQYTELYAPSMRQKTIEKWGDQFVAFRSFLEIVD